MTETLSQMVERHEGYREHLYKDSTGNLTIGIGYNVSAGMPLDEARVLVIYRLSKLESTLTKDLPWFSTLDRVRKNVLLDMAYNMGVDGLYDFRRMCTALMNKDYETAAKEMADSRWAKQVGNRATELIKMMRQGG